MADWSKALDLGSNPKGHGFKSHSCHWLFQNPSIKIIFRDNLAEWSKALDLGWNPEGHGLKYHSCHWLFKNPSVKIIFCDEHSKPKITLLKRLCRQENVQYVCADKRRFLISILASYKSPKFNLVYLIAII